MRKRISNIKHKELYLLILLIAVIAFYVYRRFLLLKQLYVYSDAGWDTYTSYWPYYMFLSDAFKSGQSLFWSFKIGLGTNIFSINMLIFDPFNLILFLFDKYHLGYALSYVAVLKILVAGIFFYLYLSKVGVSRYSALICSLLYAFNGYIILWGQHYFFATIMTLAPLLLFAFERWQKDSKWALLSVAVALIASFGFYFLYMITIYMFLYTLYRFLVLNRFEIKKLLFYYLKLFGIYLFGIGLSAVFLLPAFAVTLNSPRVSGSLFKMPFFQLDNFLYYVALVTRFFGSQIAIIGKFHPVEWWTYYEFPIVYTGLLTLLLVPQVLRYCDKKTRILNGVFIAIFMLFLVLPYFSAVMTGFSAVYYRWTFIIVLFLLFLGAKALHNADRNSDFDRRLLVETFFLLAGLVIIAILAGGIKLGWQYQNIVITLKSLKNVFLFMIAYVIIMFVFKTPKYKKFAKVVLLLVVCIEIAAFSSSVVNNNRITISPDVVKQRQGYFDKTNDVTAYLNKTDKDFFRVQKSYMSVMYTDPLVQDYKGTTAYSSLNQPYYQRFLLAQQVPYIDAINTNVIGIPNDRQLLLNLVGVKYYLTKDKADVPFGYSFVKSFGDIKLYQNNNFLPMGVTYDSFISKKDFDQLDPVQKDEILLKGFLSENNSSNLRKVSVSEIFHAQPDSIKLDAKNTDLVNIKSTENKFPKYLDVNPINTDPTIVTSLPQNNTAGNKIISVVIKANKDTEGQIFWRKKDGQFNENMSRKFHITPGEKTYNISLGNVEADYIRFDPTNAIDQIIIKDFAIKIYNNSYYNKNAAYYAEDIMKLKQNTMHITAFKENYIKGNIKLDKFKVLFLSIPYDKGWELKIDGKITKPEIINSGFIGVPLDKGNHSVELKFTPPLLKVGLVVSVLSLAAFLFLVIRRKNLFKLYKNEVSEVE